MIIMGIAEWIANIFILGIAACLWVAAIFGGMMIASLITNKIKEFNNE